jgi:hypothetical protein
MKNKFEGSRSKTQISPRERRAEAEQMIQDAKTHLVQSHEMREEVKRKEEAALAARERAQERVEESRIIKFFEYKFLRRGWRKVG